MIKRLLLFVIACVISVLFAAINYVFFGNESPSVEYVMVVALGMCWVADGDGK